MARARAKQVGNSKTRPSLETKKNAVGETEIPTGDLLPGNDEKHPPAAGPEETNEQPILASFCAISSRSKNARIPSNSIIMQNGPKDTTGAAKDGSKAINDDRTEEANDNATVNDSGAAAAATAGPAVQIIDGEIVLQESSLVVTGKRRTIQEVEADFQQVVEEDSKLAIVNATYSSYKKQPPNQRRWSVEETKQFYNALRQLGTDFSAMEMYFKDRSRKNLKKKYMAELKKNAPLIEMAMDPRRRITLDLSVFDVKVTKADIRRVAREASRPVEIDDTLKPPSNETELLNDATGPNDQKNANAEEEFDVVEEDGNDDIPDYNGVFDDEVPSGEGVNIVDETDANQESLLPEPNEPSMDDFFGGDGMEMDDEAGDDMNAEPALDEGADLADSKNMPPPPPKPSQPAGGDTPSISLVPTSSGKKKSKRPNFRAAMRKRK